MKINQEHKPKYRVFHDVNAQDIYIDTASKSLDACKETSKKIYPLKYQIYEEADSPENSPYQFCLIEIKMVSK